MARVLEVAVERWPIAGVFSISRGAKREAVVVVATIREGSLVGRGDALCPLRRIGGGERGRDSRRRGGGRRRHRPRLPANAPPRRRGKKRRRLRALGSRGEAR